MDRQMLIGIALVIVIGLGAAFIIFNPQQPPTDNGDNGGTDDSGGTTEPTPATVSGVVTDDAGNPVEGATVELDGDTVTTGSDGRYTFTVDAGSYTVTVTKPGYDSETSTVSASSGETYTVDVSLAEIVVPTGDVELTIITRHGFDILYKARERFLQSDIAEEYNIESIAFLNVNSALWSDTIERKGTIDIAWGGGPVVFDIIFNEDKLSPLTSDAVTAILDALPDDISGAPTKRYRDDDVYWVGSAISSFGFTINIEFLASVGLPEPTTWKDLANETYAVGLPSITVIGTADATLSTSNTRMFEIILQTYGWEEGWKILTQMGANARIYDRSESVRDAAIQGLVGAGTTIDFYGYTAQLENPEICKYVLPQDGTAVNADPIALMSTSPNPEAAQAFIAWILSPDGQKIWLDKTINRMPVNPEVFNTPEGMERGDLQESYETTLNAITIEFSDELALSYETSMMFFFKATLVKAEERLDNLWVELTIAEYDGDITHQEFLELVDDMGNPLEFSFIDPETGEPQLWTEEYAQSINDRVLTDAEFKEQMTTAWLEAANERYDQVMGDLQALTG
ncbi:MAG: extracellular solute-binding protein [Candidatus Bathyarchaeota archaeon]|nr:extracellular solute-binding protein [Candidatus Bathyarchaeota archaeon]